MAHRSPWTAASALLACSLAALPAAAQSQDSAGTAAKPGAVAYPDNPAGTPQAGNNGAPVATDKAACASPAKCPDKPAPSAAGAAGNGPATGGVQTPATAYPDSPVALPSTEPTGTAPHS